jgi:hypothetical protein
MSLDTSEALQFAQEAEKEMQNRPDFEKKIGHYLIISQINGAWAVVDISPTESGATFNGEYYCGKGNFVLHEIKKPKVSHKLEYIV